MRAASWVSIVGWVGIAACGDDGGSGTGMGTGTGTGTGADAPVADAAIAPYCTPRPGRDLRLLPVADGLARPVAVAAPPGDPRLFVVEQPGRIRVVADGAVQDAPYLTIEVNDLGDEQGLLGLAFHPAFADNGRLFVFYVVPGGDDLRIAEYHADPSAAVAEPAERVVLDIPHPGAGNHNGGTLAFDRDGKLLASVGDGGSADDFFGNGQDPTGLKAKLLRVDVDTGATEVWAWGLRNPWRFAIDPANGDVWIGDVGQGGWEELNVVRADAPGGNYGWSVFEGPDCFTRDPAGAGGCDDPAAYVAPATAYDRRGTGQCAIVAGVVYRGGCIPDLAGEVLFGDHCSGEVRRRPAEAGEVAYADTTDLTEDLDPDGRLYGQLAAFGLDGYGEAYVTSLQEGAVYRIELE